MLSYQFNATDVDTKDTLCINYVQKVFIEDFRYMKIHIFALRWKDEIKR